MTAQRYQAIFDWFRARPAALRALGYAQKISVLGVYLVYGAVLAVTLWQRSGQFWRVLAVPAAVYVLGTLLRAAINRPRPYEALNFTPLFPKDTKGQSMPSRHCFSAAAIVAAAFTVWVPLGVAACLLAAAAAGVWAVRTVRNELKQNLDAVRSPSSTAPGIDEGINTSPGVAGEEEAEWQQQNAPAANSVANVPKADSSSGGAASSSGARSGSGSVREPSALQTESSPASSSAAPASTQPVSGRVLNSYSGDELVYSKTLGDWRTHNGVDYAASRGAEVTAPAAGKVVETGTDDKWGPVVAIEDASGRVWRVCGTTDAKVKKGDTVSAGQTIGKVGSVSCECAEESHIHLEVMEGEKYLDPIKAMK